MRSATGGAGRSPSESPRCSHRRIQRERDRPAPSSPRPRSQAGHRVGFYTSPHLHRFPERIAIDGQPLSDDAFAAETRAAAAAARRLESSEPDVGQVTTFEMLTAMAFNAFARQGCRTCGHRGRPGWPLRLDQRDRSDRFRHHPHRPRAHSGSRSDATPTSPGKRRGSCGGAFLPSRARRFRPRKRRLSEPPLRSARRSRSEVGIGPGVAPGAHSRP